jgi:hypothetical protein
MKQLINVLASQSLPELVETAPRPSGIRSWVQSGSFYVDHSSTSEKVTLKNISLSEFTSYQGFDFRRFAFASFESMAECKSDPIRRRAIGWPMLKAYYAGFFGGHAILRAVGQSVIRLESPQTKKLTEIGRVYCGQHFSLSSGTFDLRISQNEDRSVDASLTRMDESGGAHSIFWRRFYAFLGEIILDVSKLDNDESATTIVRLQDLRTLLTSRGASTNGTWLSTARNQINYQHQFGVWFPFGEWRPMCSMQQISDTLIWRAFGLTTTPPKSLYERCVREVSLFQL